MLHFFLDFLRILF